MEHGYTQNINITSNMLTVSNAAKHLGVSRHQIVELIHRGSLLADRTAGNAFLVDASSVELLRITRRGNGRPMKPETAWAALWVLSGLEANWLNYHQQRRLCIKLSNIGAEDLVWNCRKRANTVLLRVSDSFLAQASAELVLSGANAAQKHGLNLTAPTSFLEGYLQANRLEYFIKRYHAVSGAGANIKLHIMAPPPFECMANTVMPVAVVAADLSKSLDTRERSSGLTTLKELLDARS
ncbi:MAG: excisionase family DNA-binding protein [Coriobacteriales bacterium]|jgi:excisionase family DNA binding protein|nr:excisionase family DNA-binding protein [Coriobacteriales bacterium]